MGAPMIDPLSKVERELKMAEEFFQLAKTATSPFARAYCRRVAERYLSSQGELKPARGRNETATATLQVAGMWHASASPRRTSSPAGARYMRQGPLRDWPRPASITGPLGEMPRHVGPEAHPQMTIQLLFGMSLEQGIAAQQAGFRAIMSADPWSDDSPAPTAPGIIGAGARPNWRKKAQ
jgi:hypothetical protein